METRERRSEAFLKLYRQLEGALERRYAGQRVTSSVVAEYLRDPDSAPCRAELDLCREIRNLLTHNADGGGEAVVEPSQAMLDTLKGILDHARKPRLAVDYGTPKESILFAHPNDSALDLMRHMLRAGYSHVPVQDRDGLVGVFSPGGLFAYIAAHGLDEAGNGLRVGDLKAALDIADSRSEKYRFMPPDTTLAAVREAFERREARNSRLAAVFITADGTRNMPIMSMLTPWDVLKET